ESGENTVFYDLPEALIEELLSKCNSVSESLSRSFQTIQDEKDNIRKSLNEQGLIHRDSEVASFPTNPTSCGIDGSYALERLLSTDLAVTAAVAVEGLSPPIEKRYWPSPKHYCEIRAVPHYESTSNILRAIMMCMEMELVTKAPHDVIMLDGSMTTPLIYINQALNDLSDSPPELNEILLSKLKDAIEAVRVIVEAKRSDKIYLAVPKYTTKKELSDKLKVKGYEDRGLLSFILESGEYVGPIEKSVVSKPWNIEKISEEYSDFVSSYMTQISNLKIIYYRPFEHVPTLRLEIANSIARNPQRLSVLFEALKIQCGAPSIFEPYPLYMADRMVKHLGRAIPALRRTTTQYIAERWDDRLGTIFLAMHGYRTEAGRG
ncbi:MAG: DNA double-strand break repair nuclease NurA, partial [Candidatus Micrarchaeota archaeon]